MLGGQSAAFARAVGPHPPRRGPPSLAMRRNRSIRSRRGIDLDDPLWRRCRGSARGQWKSPRAAYHGTPLRRRAGNRLPAPSTNSPSGNSPIEAAKLICARAGSPASPRLVEHDADEAQHQQRREPEGYAAEHVHRRDGMADRCWFGCARPVRQYSQLPPNRCAERRADRAYRGQGGSSAAMFVGGHHCPWRGRLGARCRRRCRSPSQRRSRSSAQVLAAKPRRSDRRVP